MCQHWRLPEILELDILVHLPGQPVNIPHYYEKHVQLLMKCDFTS